MDNLNADFYFDIFGLGSLYATFFLRKRLSLVFKSNMIISMLFVLFISDVFENGLDSPDFIIVVLIPFLAILIYKFWVSISLYIAAITFYLTVGYLFTNGIVTSAEYNPSEHSFFRWVEVVLVLSVVTIMITLFLHRFNNTIYELIENLQNQKDYLADRESLLSGITKNIPRTILTVLDRDLMIQFTDGVDYNKWQINPNSLIGLNALDTLQSFGEKKVARMKAAYDSAFGGTPDLVELTVGEETILYKILPLPYEDGEIKRILVVIENITERVQTQKLIDENLNEKNVLLQEIHHRVKNNLAVVSGLLSLQSQKAEDAESKFILEKSTNRIMSIAKVHEMLYESKNFNRIPFNRYINELSSIILDSMNYDGKAIAFETEIDVDFISINHGVPLGIIFNELITNSVKYGFNGNLNNSIKIRVTQQNERFEVTYEDNGIGIDDFKNASTKSLGFTLIESLMHQIDAEFEYDTHDKFKLTFCFNDDNESNPYQILN